MVMNVNNLVAAVIVEVMIGLSSWLRTQQMRTMDICYRDWNGKKVDDRGRACLVAAANSEEEEEEEEEENDDDDDDTKIQ